MMKSITKLDKLLALPNGAVIIVRQGYVMEKLSDGWYRPGLQFAYTNPNKNWLPAQLVRKKP